MYDAESPTITIFTCPLEQAPEFVEEVGLSHGDRRRKSYIFSTPLQLYTQAARSFGTGSISASSSRQPTSIWQYATEFLLPQTTTNTVRKRKRQPTQPLSGYQRINLPSTTGREKGKKQQTKNQHPTSLASHPNDFYLIPDSLVQPCVISQPSYSSPFTARQSTARLNRSNIPTRLALP